MEAKTLAEAKADLEKLMDEAIESHEPVIITRDGKPPVALISVEDLRAQTETAFLKRNPANHERLMRSIGNADKGLYAKELTIEDLDRLIRAAR